MGFEGYEGRYIYPHTVFGFKLLFGTETNKELLISFLNALLFGKEVIKNVTYLNTEHLGTQEYDRRAVFDVYPQFHLPQPGVRTFPPSGEAGGFANERSVLR